MDAIIKRWVSRGGRGAYIALVYFAWGILTLYLSACAALLWRYIGAAIAGITQFVIRAIGDPAHHDRVWGNTPLYDSLSITDPVFYAGAIPIGIITAAILGYIGYRVLPSAYN